MIELISCLLLLSIVVPFGVYYMNGRKSGKRVLITNIAIFFSIMLISTIMIFSGNVSAAASQTVGAPDGNGGMLYLSAALVTGLATIGAGIAVAAAASAALGAISENEKIMGKAMIFVALAEGIALYGLLVSFTILGRLG